MVYRSKTAWNYLEGRDYLQLTKLNGDIDETANYMSVIVYISDSPVSYRKEGYKMFCSCGIGVTMVYMLDFVQT